MSTPIVPDDGIRELAAQVRRSIPKHAKKAVLLAELGDGYAIPQMSIRESASSQESSIEITFDFATMLDNFWKKYISPSGAPWIALSLTIDETGFSFKTYDIPDFGRRSKRDMRAELRSLCFSSPTNDSSVHL
jgi:hypothetical protein